MYSVRFTNEGCEVRYDNDEVTNFVSWTAITAFRSACEGQFDSETCEELRARFNAEREYEVSPFALLDDSDYSSGALEAIDAVACVILEGSK